MTANPDRLYELLPYVYRARDETRGFPLKALLRVMGEQLDLLEADIEQLYENWFIETCEDWVVPFIGDLVGYRMPANARPIGDPQTQRGRLLNRALIPRREVARTIAYRRRKGTLALLETLAVEVAGWPARASECFRQLGWTQHLNHLHPGQGGTLDLRNGEALRLLDSPFGTSAHSADVRRVHSRHTRGRFNLPNIALFVWRLGAYPVTQTPAYCREDAGPHCFNFSVLGQDSPLFTRPQPEPSEHHIATEANLPVPISRAALQANLDLYYGSGKSMAIWVAQGRGPKRQLIPADRIAIADLTDWTYRPKGNQVAVDPHLGRIAFSPRRFPKQGVWVDYAYGFSAPMGGGEYQRVQKSAPGTVVYRVGIQQPYRRIGDALQQWQKDRPAQAAIDIAASGVYVEQLNIKLEQGQHLRLRATSGTRPVIRLLDWQTDAQDALTISGAGGSQITLEGLTISGRSVHLEGDFRAIHINHCTLVPGWGLQPNCNPKRPAEPSLELFNINPAAKIQIGHSILGSLQINQDEVSGDPLLIEISDAIIDATRPDREAIGAPSWPWAHAALSMVRCTVFGTVETHAVKLAEDSIFTGPLKAARRGTGCVRFCYVPTGSRTPRRYRCQPDLAVTAAKETAAKAFPPVADVDGEVAAARNRVLPRFTSERYGHPGYAQLSQNGSPEISRGASDAAEMGAFHDLFQPQRAANLRARLAEYLPARFVAGIFYAT